ncbi:poly(A) RNA polymerase, mitochondrial [Genypterus blacodes]|uniref:poly(A) RNA polymerase, mitochondrial n=1 Tax=Genypterus blacodes TaxID=154954 RepID=UPI003F76014A
MRSSPSSGVPMASTMGIMTAISRLHMRGRRGSLLTCPHKFDTCLQSIGTDVAAEVQAPGKDEAEAKNGRKSLHTVHKEGQEQADRSVLISCQGRTTDKKFLKYLSRHGDVQKYFYYESFGTYAVVEFASQESVASLLEEAAVPSFVHEAVLPFKSRLLSLKSLSVSDLQSPQSRQRSQTQTSMPINELVQRLSREETIDRQMTALTEACQLTEENVRLRFLVCSLLKDIANVFFSECAIRPFGSSVNGFGKLGCDLDMFLDLNGINGHNAKTPKSGFSLEYQMKQSSSERLVTQSILSVIGTCVDQFVPGCVGVQKILKARCPLVGFTHQPSGLQCDLTTNNGVAMKSTELLYLYGELDPRVRCLVFTVRSWARTLNITSSIPGAWISNFSLTIMVLFFLQRRSPPIIPTLDQLRDLAGPGDECTVEGHDCTFVSDWSKIPPQSNTETLEQLLGEFFDFYATFSFSTMSINIRKGKEQHKPETSPLYIQNPFETSLNVSKNVNVTLLQRFVTLCQESSWLLQQSKTNGPIGGTKGSSPAPWGLASLLLPSQVARMKARKKRRSETTGARVKSLIESLNSKNQPNKSSS